MTAPINSIIQYNNVQLIVKPNKDGNKYENFCEPCYFYNKNCKLFCKITDDEFSKIGYCSALFRNDKTDIYFKLINI